MPREGVYDFYGKLLGVEGFGIPTTLHTHRKSKLHTLLQNSMDKDGDAYLKVDNEWCWVRPTVWDAYNRSLLRVEAHVAHGFVLGILHIYPCPDADEFLVPFTGGVRIVKVPKPKLW